MSENILIELKGLTKRYGYGDTESFALKDFNLTIKRGEFIMIMGPSGCGKTTLLDIIGLLDRATYGDYILNGENVASISARRQAKLRAKKIGFIFQNFNLIEDLPIIENVALPLVYTGYSKTSRLKQASSTLGRFHLEEREYYLPYQLSGGQQQRVAIARAIVGNPEIILADEPTGNLDSHASHIVMDELKAIHDEGNTIIMVTHNPALTVYATRVIHMLDGQIDTDIKTVADANLPQPVSVKIKKRKSKHFVSIDSDEDKARGNKKEKNDNLISPEKVETEVESDSNDSKKNETDSFISLSNDSDAKRKEEKSKSSSLISLRRKHGRKVKKRKKSRRNR